MLAILTSPTALVLGPAAVSVRSHALAAGYSPTMQLSAGDDFRFGAKQSMVGLPAGEPIPQAPEPTDFRFGMSPTVVGFTGGNGMNDDDTGRLAPETTDFRFGTGQAVDVNSQKGVVVALQTGCHDMGKAALQDEVDFRFGSGRTVIGFQGGSGNGMGDLEPIPQAPEPADFRFGSTGRTAITLP